MSNTIQANTGPQAINRTVRPKKAVQAGIQGSSFSDMAVQKRPVREDVMKINAAAPQKLSEEEEMQLFRKEFYEDLEKLTNHPSINSVAVNISDAAFQAMKEDPEYREKVLSLLQRDLGSSVAPRSCSLLITVGATLEEYRGDSWPVGNDSEFRLRAKDSFYERSAESRNRRKEILEEYQEKKAQEKRQLQRLTDEAVRGRREESERMIEEDRRKKSFSSIADLLKAKASVVPETPFGAEKKE